MFNGVPCGSKYVMMKGDKLRVAGGDSGGPIFDPITKSPQGISSAGIYIEPPDFDKSEGYITFSPVSQLSPMGIRLKTK